MEFALRVDVSQLRKGLKGIQQKQLPFAVAQALTATAGRVGLAWDAEMKEKLDRPTPFTLNSVAVLPARKSNLKATVLLKDIAAAYLEPFVDGGVHFLGGKRALLGPKNVALNAYGNLSRNKVAALKGKPGVFVGPVTLKSGAVVSGVWQRTATGKVAKGRRIKGVVSPQAGHLKLLIRFADDLPVRQRLDFQGRAEKAVKAYFEPEFAKAFAKAMATAK